MPNPQVLRDIAEVEPTGVEAFFSQLGKSVKEKQDRDEIGSILSEYKQNRDDINAWEDAQLKLQNSTISPSKRLEAQDFLNNTQKMLIERDKALNNKVNKQIKSEEEKQKQYQSLIKDGYPDEEAQLYVSSSPAVQAILARNHTEEKQRGKRSPLKPQEAVQKETIETVPQGQAEPEQIVKQEQIVEFPDIPAPEEMTSAERVKWKNNNEKTNTKELEKTQTKKKAYQTNDILINSMEKINESDELPSGISKLIIDPKTGDLRPEAQLAGLVNPGTQLYVKNLKQFLKGAKDFFGARVTNFDVNAFMAQLPGLLNSKEGRRVILKQMKLVNDLEANYNNTLNDAIKHYGRNANFIDISKTVDEKVSNDQKDLLNQIDNVVEGSNYMSMMDKNPEKFKNTILMQNAEGKFKAVPKDKVESALKNKWRKF